MIYAVFDFETNGLTRHPDAPLERQPKAIEFGGALVDEEGEILDTLEVLIDPGVPLEPIITKITGLTDEDLKGQKTFPEVAPLLRAFFERADVMVAHNLPFDKSVLTYELRRHGLEQGWPWPAGQMCTVEEHVAEWGRRPKLLELFEHYVGAPLAQTHRALDDVRALVTVCVEAGLFDEEDEGVVADVREDAEDFGDSYHGLEGES